MTVEQYNRCVDDFTPGVYRFILKMVKDCDTANDVVQEAFLRMWENKQSVIEGKEKSYLFTVAYRIAIDHFRQKRRLSSITDHEEYYGALKTEGRTYSNISDILNRLIEKLPPIQRNVLLLRDYEGYSYKEISEITSLTESQVKVYIFRARVFIKERIGDLSQLI